jgi:predicted P-loop ATPase
MATLDIDYGTADVWEDFTDLYNNAAMLYSTHKHSAEHPRYRLVIPFNRQVTPAEYEPICRKIAADLGINLFDDTTYELPRLFYWPSTSRKAEYVFQVNDAPCLDVDAVLKTYTDYRDVSAWPMSSRESNVIRHEIKKAGDPTEKDNIIGAFCRTYTIEEAIETFLPDEYEHTAQADRYTYKKGSVSGGLVCYDGKYAYSHHDTDPASRQLCNAFDLVRIHKYGAQDEGSRTEETTRKPSYKAMMEFVAKDKKTKLAMMREKAEEVAKDFGKVQLPEDYSDEWKASLDYGKSGKLQSSIANIITILEHDPALAGHLVHDDFACADAVVGGLPWNKEARQWLDSDDANLRAWLERNYDITGKEKINDAVVAVFTKHSYHPIKQYLKGLTWDGTPRLDTLIIDYIGAEDTPLNRAITRKHFVAAVARVFEPGCKYDYCLIMTGAEGAGKSTLLDVMGGEWFSDSVSTMDGTKEGMAQLRRAWIIELSELTSLKRSEVEQVKAFLSKRTDIYRPAYGKRMGEFPRQCVFCGTTNEDKFLKGDTGNRRFWPIAINKSLRKYDGKIGEKIRADRNQLWAEAYHYYKEGEKLYLDDKMEKQIRGRQEEYNDAQDDPIKPILYRYLDMKLPVDWPTYDKDKRRQYFIHPDDLDPVGVEERQRVCATEFLYEGYNMSLSDERFKYYVRRVNKLMDALPNWERIASTRHCEKLYGVQRGYVRKQSDNTNDEI